MKKCCTYLVLVTLCWLFLAGTVLRQQTLASKLIRIHVLAASDSAEDQAVKLQVRDAVLRQLS
ncbi:MAG: stage II sporulation protein R, partial [Oscillospiraceae bacterium]|nr:stage II sporulation protein R [Oscillospiraceae bacterium]